jgi:hypothetical protein
MKLERRSWWGRSPTECPGCGKTARRKVVPISEGPYRWQNECSLCGVVLVKHTGEDPRFYTERPVEYVK